MYIVVFLLYVIYRQFLGYVRLNINTDLCKKFLIINIVSIKLILLCFIWKEKW